MTEAAHFFSHNDPQKPLEQFRDYQTGDTIPAVREHYRKMRSRQTLEYVQAMKKKYLTYDKPMSVWTAMEKLNALIDVSDPDITLPNVVHLIQSAEAIREDGRPDWMQLTGLIHDLGKVMYAWGCDEDGTSQKEQWGLVGDVFVVGAELPDTCVFPEFNTLNPDMHNPATNTPTGVYTPGCGLDNLHLAWGHDEYLYQVLRNHPTNTLPEAAMVMVRYHSFYPWHKGGSYGDLLGPKDAEYKEWILDFNKYDLYSKADRLHTIESIRDHYQPIIEKYLGPGDIMF